MKIQKQIPVKNYKSSGGFVYRYQKLIKDVVIPYQYAVLNDAVPGVEKSHVAANFVNAGKAVRGEDVGDGFYGMVFQDSDAAKWLEAAAYALSIFPDAELERQADEMIELIAAAQDEDGYLNTYYTIKDKEKRWTNLFEGHELYCAGHMMEAAVAYYETTGKDKLLRVMQKNALTFTGILWRKSMRDIRGIRRWNWRCFGCIMQQGTKLVWRLLSISLMCGA